MPRIVTSNLEDGVLTPLPSTGEIVAQGAVESRQVLSADRPIHLWTHKLAPGSSLNWRRVGVGRGIYLWAGSMTVNGKSIVDEGAAFIEHGADCDIRAGEAGCTILEFHRTAEESLCAGGHVHSLTKAEAPSGDYEPYKMSARVYADSDCPTCDLWLHEGRFANGISEGRHYHSQDEVIVCIDGNMMFGTRALARGSVLAVDRDAIYTFNIPQTGGAFINFRGAASSYVVLDKTGKHPPQAETPVLRAICKVAPHLVASGQAPAA